jgi:hypothetical protein
LRWACENGAQPGVIAFLAKRIPNEVGKSNNSEGRYCYADCLPIHLALSKGPGPKRASLYDVEYFWYLTLLNKYGRGKARNCQTTLEELVHLFVTTKKTVNLFVTDADGYYKTVQISLLYDLLLESTSKWSSAVVMYHSRGTSRKRKAIAV